MERVDGGSSCIWQQRRVFPVFPKHMVRWQLSNLYVTRFKSEQAATEVSCSWLQVDCQPGGGGNTDFMRKDGQQSKRSMRQVTTPSVNFSKLTAIGCHFTVCICKL